MYHLANQLPDYLSGAKCYGDDFSESEILAWYEDEAEAYADLGARDRQSYKYHYHALNRLLGFSHLGARTFEHVVGLGSAYGDELSPIIRRIKRITILDPSDAFIVDNVQGVPVTYEKPRPSGDLPFLSESVDMFTCFGVLHHIPNVSHVIQEMGRCLALGGVVLLREPTVSMGDRTRPRPGLTRRERGIPLGVMRSAIAAAGLEIVKFTPFGFGPVTLAWHRLVRSSLYNSHVGLMLDVLCSRITAWNYRYHRQTVLDRFAPSSAFWVLSKSEAAHSIIR
ncbi:MAG: class I SAM-dependent methyltransferase [Gammaproteobacteria bacterium]